MKTVTEIKTDLSIKINNDFIEGYEKAIEGILEDIRNSEVISVSSIEKYLEKLLK